MDGGRSRGVRVGAASLHSPICGAAKNPALSLDELTDDKKSVTCRSLPGRVSDVFFRKVVPPYCIAVRVCVGLHFESGKVYFRGLLEVVVRMHDRCEIITPRGGAQKDVSPPHRTKMSP